MRHFKTGRKFNRDTSHRKAMLNNLTYSILKMKLVQTTSAKAKDVRRIVDKLISLGKKDTIHHRQLAFKIIKNHALVKELFNKISVKYINKPGGYTQIIKNGFRRGDYAPMSIIKLID